MDELEKKQAENQEQTETKPHSSRLEERRRSRGREPWMVGVILIFIGVIFLMQNFGGYYVNNWWALFILIPAFGSFSRAWQMMQSSDGQLTSSARSALIGGLVLTSVAAILLFNLDWIIFGPILLIVVGLAMLINAIMPK